MKERNLPLDEWMNNLVHRYSAKYGAWSWGQSLLAHSKELDLVQALALNRDMNSALEPWVVGEGDAQYKVKEQWDLGVSTTLGLAFARAAPKYAQAGMLHNHIELLANGIIKSSDEGLHNTNRGLSVVFGCLMPPLFHPEVQKSNPRARNKYLSALTELMQVRVPDQKPVFVHHLPVAIKESISDCDKYGLWPNDHVRDHVVGLHQARLKIPNTGQP